MTIGIGGAGAPARIIGADVMFLLPQYRRLLLTIGLATWLVASVPTIWDVCNRPPLTPVPRFSFWIGSFLVFGICFWLTFVDSSARFTPRQITLVSIQTVAALLMVYLVPCYSIGIVLVVVAWQVALLLTLRLGLAWIGFQTAILAAILYSRASGLALFAMSSSLAFQLFAFITASVAKSEAKARRELASANAELRATRELLAESSRITERSRIFDELHDVVGHNLTALNIHLEVARHLAEGKALEHVQKSQAVAKLLLQDVRDVVSAAGNDQLDIRRAVEAVVEGLPYPIIHLSLAGDLKVEDSECAHTLLRCIQEIITNTLRHSGAQNLWLEVSQTEGGVEVRAKDDGRGASSIQAGNGIGAMRRRLERIGGRMRIETSTGDGFKVDAWVPLTEAL
jgi:signal transduction histidine kinase